MATYTYATFTYDFSSGVLGHLVLGTQASDADPGLNSLRITSVSGSINGQAVVGLSDFGNPNNLAFNSNPVGYYPDGTVVYDPWVDGFSSGYITNKDYDHFDSAKPNGVSVSTQDGTSYHFYVTPAASSNGGFPYRLVYEDSKGNAGSVTDTATFTGGCFGRGARVLLEQGEVAIERVRPGDRVLTDSGHVREIIWVGHSVARSKGHPKPQDILPIRIMAGAIATGVPSRDLILSPGHALYLDGILVRACDLVNGATIVQEAAEVIHYYHLELETHDVVIVDGTPCETYLDDDNRLSFLDAGEYVRLHGRIDPVERQRPCAPVVENGPILATIRTRLLARALQAGWRLAERTGLRLQVDGRELLPIRSTGMRHWFLLPGGSSSDIVVLSSSVRIDRVTPHCTDERRLGVALAELRVDGDWIDLSTAEFGSGFFPYESDGTAAWRWTDGAGHLRIPHGSRMVEVALRALAPQLTRDDLPVAAVA